MRINVELGPRVMALGWSGVYRGDRKRWWVKDEELREPFGTCSRETFDSMPTTVNVYILHSSYFHQNI